MLRWRPPSREARLANHQVARIAGGDLCPRTRRAWVSWNPGESGSILSLRAWDGPHTCCVVFRPRRYGETQQLGPSIVVRRAVTSGPRCHRMMFFPGGKVRDVSESFLSALEKRASLAAEPRNAPGARDQLVASPPPLERVGIRMSGIGLGDVETCDNTATTNTVDSMGGAQRSASRQLHPRSLGSKATAFDCRSNFGYWTSISSTIIWWATIADTSADV